MTCERPNPWIWLVVSAICLSLTFGLGYLLSVAFFTNGAKHSAMTGNSNAVITAQKTSTTVSALLIQDSHDGLMPHPDKDDPFTGTQNMAKGSCCHSIHCHEFTGKWRQVSKPTHNYEVFLEGAWRAIAREKEMDPKSMSQEIQGMAILCLYEPYNLEGHEATIEERIVCFRKSVEA